MNPARHFERTSKEYIILSLSLMAAVALFPFSLHRIMTHDWAIAALDITLLSLSLYLFVYVYKTRKTDFPSLMLSFVFLFGEVASVALKGTSQVVWVFPCTVGIYYLTSIPRAAAINGTALILIYSLAHRDFSGLERTAFLIALIATNLFTIVFAARNQIQKKQLEELTLIDPLTAVHNRRAFENFLDELDIKGGSGKRHQSIILLDVDHFKKINDEHGHLAGDDALIRLISLIQTQIHADENIYRIGGEEYVISPLDLDLSTTFEFAERLRKIIEHSNVNEKLGLTVSIGVAELRDNEPAREWVRRADQALYEAKQNGRNQTRSAE